MGALAELFYESQYSSPKTEWKLRTLLSLLGRVDGYDSRRLSRLVAKGAIPNATQEYLTSA